MNIEEIKEKHDTVSQIGGTMNDYKNAHAVITVQAIIDELAEIHMKLENDQDTEIVEQRINELQSLIDQ